MADEVTTQAAETPAAAPQTDARPGTAEFARAYGQHAQVLADQEKAAAETPIVPESSAEKTKGKRGRGKDGKYVAGEQGSASSHKAGEPGTSPGPATTKPAKETPAEEPEKPAPAKEEKGLKAQAQRLIGEGRLADALGLIGLSPDKLTGKQWDSFNAREAKARETLRQANAKESELRQIHGALLQQFSRYEAAEKAYKAENYAEALKLAFGEDHNEFNRKLVQGLHTKDPHVARLERELREEREARQRQESEQRQAIAQAQANQRRKEYIDGIPDQVRELDDPRFERVAARPAFVRRIFEIQQESYDEHTDYAKPLAEAAEQAWDELYSDLINELIETSETSTERPSKGDAPARGGVAHVRPAVRKPATTLNPNEAAEAAATPKLKGRALMDAYVRKAIAAQAKELNGR